MSVSTPASRATPARVMSLEREDSFRARLAARDESALRELVQVLSPWLLGFAQAMLQDRDEAEEAVMDAFRIAWERIPPPGEGPRGLVPWLLRVTRNRALDRLRTRRRRVRLRERLSPGLEATTPAVEPDEAGAPGWHVHAAVHRALNDLPEEQRHAVCLAYFEGRTHSEIAARLDAPLGTVKTRLRLGMARLRDALAPLKDWVV